MDLKPILGWVRVRVGCAEFYDLVNRQKAPITGFSEIMLETSRAVKPHIVSK